MGIEPNNVAIMILARQIWNYGRIGIWAYSLYRPIHGNLIGKDFLGAFLVMFGDSFGDSRWPFWVWIKVPGYPMGFLILPALDPRAPCWEKTLFLDKAFGMPDFHWEFFLW